MIRGRQPSSRRAGAHALVDKLTRVSNHTEHGGVDLATSGLPARRGAAAGDRLSPVTRDGSFPQRSLYLLSEGAAGVASRSIFSTAEATVRIRQLISGQKSGVLLIRGAEVEVLSRYDSFSKEQSQLGRIRPSRQAGTNLKANEPLLGISIRVEQGQRRLYVSQISPDIGAIEDLISYDCEAGKLAVAVGEASVRGPRTIHFSGKGEHARRVARPQSRTAREFVVATGRTRSSAIAQFEFFETNAPATRESVRLESGSVRVMPELDRSHEHSAMFLAQRYSELRGLPFSIETDIPQSIELRKLPQTYWMKAVDACGNDFYLGQVGRKDPAVEGSADEFGLRVVFREDLPLSALAPALSSAGRYKHLSFKPLTVAGGSRNSVQGIVVTGPLRKLCAIIDAAKRISITCMDNSTIWEA